MKIKSTFLPLNSNLLSFKLNIKIVLLLCSSVLYSLSSQGQYNSKAPVMYLRYTSALSLQLGGTNFLGDLGGNSGSGKPFIKDLNLKATRLFAGLSYSYFIDNGLSINGDFHYTTVAGADSLITEKTGHAAGRYNRNLSFKSSIYEFQTTVKIYPIQMLNDEKLMRVLPYIGLGFGFFHFNPRAELNGSWYDLQPLHLEGQDFAEYPERHNYKLTQPYIPLMVGVSYRLSNSYLISLDAIFRTTFTDYIDDASTTYVDPSLFDKYLSAADASIAKQLYYRGRNSSALTTNSYRGYSGNDSYTSAFLTLTYLFNKGSLPSYHDKPPVE